MSLVGLNIGTHDSLSAKTRRFADYYRQLAAGTVKEVVDDETVTLGLCFYRSPVEKVTFTKCTKIINYGAFTACTALLHVDFPELISVGVWTFQDTTKLSYAFFPKVVSVGANGFMRSGIEEVELPKCTTLGSSAFAACKKLKKIKIPVCKTIEKSVFSECSALEEIFLGGVTVVPSLINSNALNGTPDTMKIIVPDALVDSFKTATNWSTYAGRIIGVSEYEATQVQ